MSAKRTAQEARHATAVVPPPARERKKTRAPRVRLTHFEIRRGEKLRLRIAVADDALAEVGDELAILIKKAAPGASPAVVEAVPMHVPAHVEGDDGAPQVVEDFVVSAQHDANDATYHASLREHLTALFNSLCDTALADALEIAREVRARRAEGGN